jgi:hypothetical protein
MVCAGVYPPSTALSFVILQSRKGRGTLGGGGGGWGRGWEGGGGAIWELREGSSKIREAYWVSESAVEVTVNRH